MGATGDTNDRPAIPRSIRHKRILDVAADRPDASFASIADDVPSASADLVEEVLNQYGDPAEVDGDDHLESPPEPGDATPDLEESPPEVIEESPQPDLSSVTDKQREILDAIQAHPEATQMEIGEIVGVSGATICCHVNNIDGFEWSDRAEFVANIMNSPTTNGSDADRSQRESPTLEVLEERVQTLETRLEETDDTAPAVAIASDPELAHKILHACMASEKISEAEEKRIVRAFLE